MVKEFSNENIKKVIQTRNTKIGLSDEGIVMVTYPQGIDETLEDAEENLNALDKICNGKKLPIFIDPGPHKSLSREARIYYVKHSPEYAIAVAVLVKSTFAKVLSAFLITLNKTINKGKFPIQFFTSQEKALDWLRRING
ncbi:MAG: hypothetical protein OEV78_06960 [Spirochaetia bacterium]|nr:hypothetical protein [Spirochaetia bacterium]